MITTDIYLSVKNTILLIVKSGTNFINKGQERSVKARKNIISSFFLKGISIIISLILVPITIHYITPSGYGIWLTISSIVGWFSFFNIGLTQGLRNKFAEAKAKGEHNLAQIYVSTTYATLIIIFSLVWLVFLVSNNFLDWHKILKVPASMETEVSVLAVIVFTYFCLQFVLKVVTTLLLADQQPAKSSLVDVLGQLGTLLFIFILVKTTEGSLIKLGVALCLSPILVLIGANMFFFSRSFKKYKPQLSKVKFSYAKNLFNLGIVFFVIQVAGIIQFQTANFIIARNFGTSDVTNYNIVYKYFGLLNMVFVIFLTPFWSASTEAYFKNDIRWIKKAVKSYNILGAALSLLGIIMLIFSHTVYELWLGKGTVNIDILLSVWGLLYFLVSLFGGTYVYFLNGINALRIQFYASVLSPVIYICAAIVLIKYFKMGVYSMFVSSVISNFNGFLLAPIQYHMIINKKRKGIWIR